MAEQNLIINREFEGKLNSKGASYKLQINGTVNDVDIVGHLDMCRSEVTRRLEQSKRVTLGQFLTPASVARLMASMFSKSAVDDVRIIDPGAGIGTLFAALVQKLCNERSRPKKISVTAYEVEPTFIDYLEDTIRMCKTVCDRCGIQFNGTIRQEDFIASAVSTLRGDLFSGEEEKFTHAILNPPYHKIRSDSQARKMLRSCGVETSNVYTAFLALTSLLLVVRGELVSITPRSFCNGVYFRPFRKKFLQDMNIERLHLFHSRKEAFRDDDVLQENIIMKARRDGRRPLRVTISSSLGAGDDIEITKVDASDVVSPDDDDSVIQVPTDDLENRIAKLAARFTNTLGSLGLQVSTGPVVDFRTRGYIVSSANPEAVPLIYPNHFDRGYVRWPATHSKKPDGILRSAQTERLLLSSQCHVLVKRFSAKEEKRRIVAAIYDPDRFAADIVGFENHLNYFHSLSNGLDINLAKGLAAFLNSTIIDTVFRLFSGHTQVNAGDLRRIKYPSWNELETLGSHIGAVFPSQDELDQIVERELFGTGTLESQESPLSAKEKIQQALTILKAVGLSSAQQNERSALTLLAILGLKPSDRWEHASDPLCGITPMMEFFSKYYGKVYKPNTRETVRRQTVHQFLAAGLVVENPDEPSRPINGPKVVYRVEKKALELMRTFGSPQWTSNLQRYLASVRTLRQQYAQEREMKRIPIQVSQEQTIYLSPGGQNVLVKKVIEEFGPRFTPCGNLVYVGDTEEKFTLFDEPLLNRLGVRIDTHGKMPDIIIYYEKRNWLVLIEAVTSHGPVDPKRREELKQLFKGCTAGLVFVTAFLTRRAMVEYLDDISWETEVWVAEAPSHLIHFNGERFLGPYPL